MAAKARLVEIEWDEHQQQFNQVPEPQGIVVPVQFNPESLKVSFSNQNRGGNQPSGGGGQFVGSGTSKMSVELLFDTTETGADVRRTTQLVAKFVQTKERSQNGDSRNTSNNRVPPGISFEWGTFIFRGVVESMDETLEYFSEEGVPLRAAVSLSLTRQEIKFEFGQRGQAGTGTAQPPGTQPLSQARPGDSVQQMAARQGRSGDWKAIAAANSIENPLRLQAGALLNMNAGASLGGSGSVGASISADVSAGAAFGAGASASASAGGQAGFSAGLGGGAGFGAAGFGGGASASFGAGGSAGVSASLGASAGFGGGASAGFGTGAGANATFGASAGISAQAGTSAGITFGTSTSAGARVSLLEE